MLLPWKKASLAVRGSGLLCGSVVAASTCSFDLCLIKVQVYAQNAQERDDDTYLPSVTCGRTIFALMGTSISEACCWLLQCYVHTVLTLTSRVTVAFLSVPTASVATTSFLAGNILASSFLLAYQDFGRAQYLTFCICMTCTQE